MDASRSKLVAPCSTHVLLCRRGRHLRPYHRSQDKRKALALCGGLVMGGTPGWWRCVYSLIPASWPVVTSLLTATCRRSAPSQYDPHMTDELQALIDCAVITEYPGYCWATHPAFPELYVDGGSFEECYRALTVALATLRASLFSR